MVRVRSSIWLLLLLLVAAGMLRAYSLTVNTVPHNDVEMEAFAAATFAREGRLLNVEPAPPGSPMVQKPVDLYLTQHPPIVPMLGGMLMTLRGVPATFAEGYLFVRFLSLISGLLLIVLAFLVAARLLGETAGLVIAMWMSFSYLLIDYSGNGAIYSLQAALYLVWILVTFIQNRHGKACAIGIATGVAYLINFQSIVLIPASVCLLLLQGKNWKYRCQDIVLMLLIAFVVTLPWFIRNFLVFGDALMSHHVASGYLFMKAGLPEFAPNGIDAYHATWKDWIDIIIGMLRVWIPNNLFYVARKLFILAPIAFLFFSFAFIEYLFSWKRCTTMAPVLLLFTFHLLLSVAWPITKFRYFVPLLPLVFIISLDQLLHTVTRRNQRMLWVGLITCSIVTLSFLTWNSLPTHTYYFDGALTTDPFHGFQERDFMRSAGLLPPQ